MKTFIRIKNLKTGARAVTLAWGLVFAALVGSIAAEDVATTPAPPAKTRVGIYNSRAVALAYYRSKDWAATLARVRREHQEAQAAGDKKRMAELETFGETSQRRAHEQTFGNAPIDNILAAMTNALPQIQKEANVQRIVAETPNDPLVEAVDVTSLMVNHFQPTEKTLNLIEDLKKHPPRPEKIPPEK